MIGNDKACRGGWQRLVFSFALAAPLVSFPCATRRPSGRGLACSGRGRASERGNDQGPPGVGRRDRSAGRGCDRERPGAEGSRMSARPGKRYARTISKSIPRPKESPTALRTSFAPRRAIRRWFSS